MNSIASRIAGISMIIAPASGLPSDPIAVPVIFASFTGASAISMLPSSCPTATVTRCASAGLAVPG